MQQLIDPTLRLSAPLVFAALGGVLSERVGVVNIALEGMLLGGAFAGMVAAYHTGQPWLGVLAAAGCGAGIGLLHAGLVLRLRVDPIISGVGINLLALGLTTFLARAVYTKDGVAVQVGAPAPWLAGLANVPVIGTLVGAGSPLVPLALIAAAAVWFVAYRMRAGLQLRAVGENPKAALTAGVPVDGLRFGWLAVGGALAGMGGAYLSLVTVGRFTENISAGKGYLALAAVIFGRWHPLGATLAVVGFMLVDAFQSAIQGTSIFGIQLPADVLSTVPYLLGLVALAGALGKSAPPAGLGQFD